MSERREQLKQGERAAWIGIITYFFLSLIKILTGISFSSKALVADGLNNLTDIINSVILLIGLKIAQAPADTDHHYGHLRAETVATIISAIFMGLVGLEVIWQGAKALYLGAENPPHSYALIVAIASSIIMFVVYIYNIRLGKRLQSEAVIAVAYDNRSDSLVSLGAFIGILGAIAGWYWLDAVTAILVGIIIPDRWL